MATKKYKTTELTQVGAPEHKFFKDEDGKLYVWLYSIFSGNYRIYKLTEVEVGAPE